MGAANGSGGSHDRLGRHGNLGTHGNLTISSIYAISFILSIHTIERLDVALLTPEQVATELNVSRSTVLRMIADGSLPVICLRRGKRKGVYRVREEQLARWILNKEREGAKSHAKPHAPPRPQGAENNGGSGASQDNESHAF